MRKYLVMLATAALLTSCGEYQRALKSTDANYRLDYAKRAFEEKKYTQASTVLEDIVTQFKGSEKAEDALYLLALSNYENKDYQTSGEYFKTYYARFPKGKYTELARFYTGYGYYLDSPEPQLDQSGTIKAIEELQSFLDYYPKSDKVSIAQNAIFELQDKLTLKQLENAQLYYNLGTYMGNNYESAVIVAKNAIKDYPYSKYKEDLELLVLKARYQEARESIDEKKADRFREVIDEYYSYINNYPDTPNREEADNIFKIAQRYVKDWLAHKPHATIKNYVNYRDIMDYKKTNAPLNTQTRDLIKMSEDTGNVYETVCIIAKRSNQIAGEMKHDLEKKLQEFASLSDNLEEISENREQIEISRFYERLPKPTLIATQEYLDHKIHFRNPSKDHLNMD